MAIDATEGADTSDFEKAIAACGFGIYNICLLIVSFFVVTATIFEVQTMSYILPSAECDLRLSLFDKGLLNAITYAGMILPALGWGLLADTVGRKWVMIYGLNLNALIVLLSSLSQDLWHLLVLKFSGGFVNCGPFAVIMSYLSESHGRKHRSRVMMAIGLLIAIACFFLPTIAYIVLSKHILFNFSGLRIHTWQLFLAISAIPGFISGNLLMFFPESPKFLLSQGRNDEALQVCRRIYRCNTGNPEDTFPFSVLHVEGHIEVVGKSKKERFLHFLEHSANLLKIMFSHPYVLETVRFFLILFLMMLSTNSVRLWLPQLFASFIQAEEQGHPITSMCDLLQYNVNKTTREQDKPCDVHLSPESYLNNIYVAAAALAGNIVAIICVRYVGNAIILKACLLCSLICGVALYWSMNVAILLTNACIFMTSAAVSFTTATSLIVETFPTHIRTMVVIIAMTFGRVGGLVGNTIFPFFISWGCLPPFILIVISALGSLIFSLIKLPYTMNRSLD